MVMMYVQYTGIIRVVMYEHINMPEEYTVVLL